jgi:hypothetical protein
MTEMIAHGEATGDTQLRKTGIGVVGDSSHPARV